MLINIFQDLSFCCPIIQTILLKISYQSILSSSNSRFHRPWEIVSCFNITTLVTPICFTNAKFNDTQKHWFVSNSCIPTSSDILTQLIQRTRTNCHQGNLSVLRCPNLSLLPPGLVSQCAVQFTPISFFELNYHQESLQTNLITFQNARCVMIAVNCNFLYFIGILSLTS